MRERLNNIPILKERRKALRLNMTEEEIILWEHIKDSKLDGRKFRRQHSVGYYIADFYCPKEKLAIELDGFQHYSKEGLEKDIYRDKHLNDLGIKVLRFRNEEVKNFLLNVLNTIRCEFNNQPSN